MNKEFLNKLILSHKESKSFPSTFSICKIIDDLLDVVFPGQSKKHYRSDEEIESSYSKVRYEFEELISALEFEEYSVLYSIYHENLVRKDKIISIMSSMINKNIDIYSYSIKEKNKIEPFMKRIWIYDYLKNIKFNDINYKLILDLDAIRSIMKIVQDNELDMRNICRYSQKYQK